MIRRIYLVYILVLQSYLLIGQEDSIKFEIKNYPDSKYETILKGRHLIEKYLENGNTQKVKQIKDYLLQTNQGEYTNVFKEFEYWLLLYNTQEYRLLLENIAQTGLIGTTLDITNTSKQINPFQDSLFEYLDLNYEGTILIINSLDESSFSQEEKDLLLLHYNFCHFDSELERTSQEKLNGMADDFLYRYPYSIYGPFVKKKIRVREKISKLAIGYGIYFGYTPFSGAISESLNNSGNIGFALDLYYSNLYFSLSYTFSGSTIKKDIQCQQNQVWEKNMSANIFMPAAQIGYLLFNKSKYNLTPFIGISFLHIEPGFEDILVYPVLENVYFDSNPNWSAGLSINLFSKPNLPSKIYKKSHIIQVYTQLKYTYSNFTFNQNSNDFNGSLHQLSLQISLLSRKVYRIY